MGRMKSFHGWVGAIGLLTASLLLGSPCAYGDGSTGATSTDAWAKERTDEFKELSKKKTLKAGERRLEILKEFERAPCRTAQRFLFGLFKKRATPGDHRLYALRSLLKMADEKTLDGILATLSKAKDPTLWQAFGEYLAQRLSDTVRAWRTGPGLAAKKSEVVCACLDSLALKADASCTERIADLYAKHAAKDDGGDVAYRALRALVRASGKNAKATLLEAARHADWRLRLGAAEALPAIEPFDAEVEAAVRALMQDDEAYVRQTVALRVGVLKRSALAKALIGLLTDPRVRTRHVAATALEAICGKKLGYDPKAWAAWLADQDPGTPETMTFPTYHGFTVHSDRVVFLVDASSSMTWPWRKETHRIDVALSELQSVLGQLTPETLFNVIVFSEKPSAWKKEEVEASPKNVKSAAKWAERMMAEPQGDTFLYEALEAAFANNPQFDTIYLLTDGNPTAGRYWTQDGLLASVRAWTRTRRTAIHTIGLSLANEDRGLPNLSENLHVMAKLMRALAAATSGQFREILRVPAAK